MTQEEKAKRYDEALEKAKIWQEHLYDANDKDYADELNYIFPELAESEDERIRKEIINYFKCQSRDEPSRRDTHNKWISYIEKHTLSKDDYAFLRDCARVLKTFGWQSYADRLTGLCPALGEEAKAMMSTPIIFDEQGEQKPAPVLDIKIPFGAKDSELIEETIFIPNGCYAVIKGNKVIIRKFQAKRLNFNKK